MGFAKGKPAQGGLNAPFGRSGQGCGTGAAGEDFDVRTLPAGRVTEALEFLRRYYSGLSWGRSRDPAETMLGRAVASAATPPPGKGTPVVLAAHDPVRGIAGLIAADWEQPDSPGTERRVVALVPWSPAVEQSLALQRRREIALALIREAATQVVRSHPASSSAFPPPARYVMRYTPADDKEALEVRSWYSSAGFVSCGGHLVMARRLHPADDPGVHCGDGGAWRLVPIDPASPAGFQLAVALTRHAFADSDDPRVRERARSAEHSERWVRAAVDGRRGGVYQPGLWFAAEDESGRQAGFLFIVDRGAEGLHIADLGVLPEFRRRGLGGLLVHEALRIARDGGKAAVSLFVLSCNHAALRLYQRAGFGKVTTFCSMERTPEMAAELPL